MAGETMNTTKEAITLFIQSLPKDSMFEIISFGSNFTSMSENGFYYNDETLNLALRNISNF
jgi:hypothetical protein